MSSTITIPVSGPNGGTVALLALVLVSTALVVAVDKLGAYLRDNAAERADLDAKLNPHVRRVSRAESTGVGRRRLAPDREDVATLTLRLGPLRPFPAPSRTFVPLERKDTP